MERGPTMLTEEQRESVRQEEIFRAEIRGQLEHQTGPVPAIWKFLNSSFALWLIGSLVATGITLRVDNNNRRQLSLKLDTEIAARVYRVRGYLRRMESDQSTVLNVSGLIRGTGPVRDQPYPMGVFSEYSQRTLESLIWELSTAVRQRERASILTAMDAARSLRDIQSEITTPMGQQPEQKCIFILRLYQHLNGALSLERWNRISRPQPVEPGPCGQPEGSQG